MKSIYSTSMNKIYFMA